MQLNVAEKWLSPDLASLFHDKTPGAKSVSFVVSVSQVSRKQRDAGTG